MLAYIFFINVAIQILLTGAFLVPFPFTAPFPDLSFEPISVNNLPCASLAVAKERKCREN